MSIQCGTCAMHLTRAMAESSEPCPNCAEIRRARRVHAELLEVMKRLVVLLEGLIPK